MSIEQNKNILFLLYCIYETNLSHFLGSTMHQQKHVSKGTYTDFKLHNDKVDVTLLWICAHQKGSTIYEMKKGDKLLLNSQSRNSSKGYVPLSARYCTAHMHMASIGA